MAAERWLQEVKRHLEVMGWTPTEKIKLAVYRLAGWEACVRHYGQTRLDALIWDEFCQLFERKFIPVHEQTKLQEQYESLVQGQTSVEEYYQKFDELSYYSPNETKTDRVARFKKGLSSAIQHKVGYLKFDSVMEAVESASKAKSMIIWLRRDGDHGKRKFDSRKQSGTRSVVQNTGENRPYQGRSDQAGGSGQ